MAEPAATSLTPLQRAFLALQEARARVAELEGASREPVAIIGLGVRAPGGVSDADSFWRLLADGVDAIGPVPSERWNHDRLYDPDPDTPGRIATRHGGFLSSVDHFDAAFFGISPREAERMDPQQRLLLTVAWEALEHAGVAPDRLGSSRTGVFVGVTGSDYAYLQLATQDPALLDAHFASGIAHSIFSGRISYLLGLQGPSLTVDTACSSSLVATHLAVQALRNGDCRLALAGGVNLILAPDIFVSLSRARMLAPDGRCKAFAATADGFARAEGCGVLVLKRLSDALGDGDRVLAVIRGSMVNQDGASSSLTAPNGPAQEAVIREALSRAGVKPDDIGLLEAHGTGTELGDPIEAQALGAVFGRARPPSNPLRLGSVKTNIGHAEAAAGVLGIIKAVLAIRHRAVPAHLHFDTPSPHIRWDALPFDVPTCLTPWNSSAPRLAGVSSFGFSGTNAHVVLAEAPDRAPAAAREDDARLLALSARDEEALALTIQALADRLRTHPDVAFRDVVRTVNCGRAQFPHRTTVLARTAVEARDALSAVAAGEPAKGTHSGYVAKRDPLRVAFLFTGQGSQYAGMARELYARSPLFRDRIDHCAKLLEPHLARPLVDVLFSTEAGLLDRTEFTQPALFAVEFALSELWRSWGITPSVVIGHSIGEYVAATVAGVLDLADALRLVAARGKLMQSLPAGGGMAAVFAPEATVAEAIAASGLAISVAAVNGPLQTVVSGPSSAVGALCENFAARGITSSRLPVSHAFHSALVDPVLPAFDRELARTRFSPPKLRLISNLTGQSATARQITEPSYWRDHMRQPVRFGDGLKALAATKPDLCIEIGPHPALLSFAGAAFDGVTPLLIPSLRKGRPDLDQMLDNLAHAWCAGAAVDWSNVDRDGQVVDLPGHPLRGKRHWFNGDAKIRDANRAPNPAGLPGARLELATGHTIYDASVGADQPGYLREHRVQSRIVLPATAYLTSLAAIARDMSPERPTKILDVVIGEAMLLDDDGRSRNVQSVLDPDGADAFRIRVMSRDPEADGDWTQHLSCRLSVADTPSPASDLADAETQCNTVVAVDRLYHQFEALGLEFGPVFRSIRRLSSGPLQALGEIVLDGPVAETQSGPLHPVLLDGCLQVAAAAMPVGRGDKLHLPIGIGAFTLVGAVREQCFSHVRVRSGVGALVHCDITVYAPDRSPVATLTDVQFAQVDRDALARLGTRRLDDCLFEPTWAPTPAARSTPAFDPALLTASAESLLPILAAESDIATHDKASEHLERLCADYTVAALEALGIRLVPGSCIVVSELAERVGVVARHRRLFARLFSILETTGMLARRGDGWLVLSKPQTVNVDIAARQLLAAEPSLAAELEMTARVAPRLAEALLGRVEAADLLFPGGSTANAEHLYRDSPTARLFNGLMANLASAVAAARGAGRPLRILEVGGGTGGTTSHVLPRLPADVTYTFTDIGPVFVARARERFGSDSRLEFTTLDLDREPAEQGFGDRQFDIVIASNVVHATADLRQTLARLHRLIVPGGLLAMLEVTEPQRWFDLTVGLTEGWWSFTDTALRPDYPTLPRDSWLDLLKSCAFDAVATVPRDVAHVGALSRQSIFVARAQRRPWLLFESETTRFSELAESLRRDGDTCIVVRPGTYAIDGDTVRLDPTSPADYRRLSDDLANAGRVPGSVVHAWSLDTGPDASVAFANERGVLSVLSLTQALLSMMPVPRLWLLTSGAQSAGSDDRALVPVQAPVWGLGRSLAIEHPALRCTSIDVGAASVEELVAELSSDPSERDVVLASGRRFVARLTRWRPPALSSAEPAPWRLVTARTGSIEAFERAPLDRRTPGPGEVEIAVEATGLNFKDVLGALGLYPGDAGALGSECAGRVLAVGAGVDHVAVGDGVMAVAGGSFASHVMARAELVRRRPAEVAPEEAATFPIAFLTASFCLDHVAGLTRGETVLVHAAAGGVGLAAVQIARLAGARVIATAGSAAKRAMLHSLGIVDVFDSRSETFAADVLRVTAGRGADVVLNSLGGDLVEPSFRAIADGGRFVEIGKRGIKSHEWVSALERGLRYDVVDWGDTAARDPALIGRIFERLVDDLTAGRLTPLPRHTFALERVADAFRLMAQAGHIGRIAISHRHRGAALARRDGSYLITGGLSGLGLATARHLAERGAGRLVLIGRSAPDEEALRAIDEIRRAGTECVAEAADVTDEAALASIISRVRAAGPPLRGIIHAAGVLANGALLQQTTETFERVLAPKMTGAALLDRLTRSEPLDWFVMYSSVAGILGAAGQANHAAANAYLDQLIRQRQALGLCGLSIDWGAWSEVGAAAALGTALGAKGVEFLTPAQGLAALDRLVESGTPQAAVLAIDWQRYRSQIGPDVHASLLSELGRTTAVAVQPERPAKAPTRDFRREVEATPAPRRARMISEFLRERVATALGMDPARPIDPRMPFGDLGLDSLLSVELRNTLGAALGQTFPATLLFDHPTLESLSDFVFHDWWGEPQPVDAATPPDTVARVEDLSDEEVDRLLRSKYGVSAQ